MRGAPATILASMSGDDARAAGGYDAPRPRVFLGGFLMGVANLVPGLSGGTMILVVGLYDAFIRAVAELTTLRWSRALFLFLAVFGVGAVLAVGTLARPAVWLVDVHRWLAFSLFIGMTLGGVPDLVREMRPIRASEIVSITLGLAAMLGLVVALRLTDAAVPQNFATLAGIGALAAASMILPGISGSFILLVFGFYGVVVGSLDHAAFRAHPGESLAVIVPVGLGVAAGMGLLSNALKRMLTLWRGPVHGTLLGLLVGSVAVLWPFQEPEHPDLARRETRKAIEALVIDGADLAALHAKHGGADPTPERVEAWRTSYAGMSRDDLKRLAVRPRYYAPSVPRVALSIAVLAAGYALTRAMARRG